MNVVLSTPSASVRHNGESRNPAVKRTYSRRYNSDEEDTSKETRPSIRKRQRVTRSRQKHVFQAVPLPLHDSPPSSGQQQHQPRLGKDALLSNNDVLSHITSFLDVKSLYRFTMTSKTCLNSLRPEHVVRSALYHGGHAKINLERILHMVRNNNDCIIVPSPLRLLRLCIGRLCELCQEKRVNYVSKHFGVFFCKRCLECDSNNNNSGYVQTLRRFDPLYLHVSHLHFIPAGCHALKVWARPYIHNGERCGPRSSLECQIIKSSCDSNSNNADPIAEDPRELERRNKLLPLMEDEYKNHVEAADTFILVNRVDKFLTSLAANDKKVQRIKTSLDRLDKELGTAVWKKELLAHTWSSVRGKDQIMLSAPLAQEILGHDIAAPSRLTKARIHELATHLRQAVEIFEDLGLHDFSFFSNAHSSWERTFQELCLDVFPDYKLLSKPWVNLETLGRLRRIGPAGRVHILSHRLHHQLVAEEFSEDE